MFKNRVSKYRCAEAPYRYEKGWQKSTLSSKPCSAKTVDTFNENAAKQLIEEKTEIQQQLNGIKETEQKRSNTKSRLNDIYTILNGLKNHPYGIR